MEEHSPNILVLSNAGKPIYTKFNNEDEDDEKITVACGCIQALIATTALIDKGTSSNCDSCTISSINAGNLKIVFLVAGSIILVAISDSNKTSSQQRNEISNMYLRLQLEYIYLQILLTLTKQVQDIYTKNPSFDLRRMLGSDTDEIMNNILYKMNHEIGCFLTSGIEIVSPLPYKVREEVSSILISNIQKLQSTKDDDNIAILYVLVLIQKKYFVTIVQPKFKQYYLYSSDLQMLLNFLQFHQEEQKDWIPLCLPRFNSSGFVYAYTCSLHEDSDLSLCVICANNSHEQFQLLRDFSLNIQIDLGIVTKDTALNQEGSDYNNSNHESENENAQTTLEAEQNQQQLPQRVLEDTNKTNAKHTSPLIKAITYAMSKEKQQSRWNNYSNIAMALHFLFRFDVCINPTSNTINSPGSLMDSSNMGSNGTFMSNNNTLTQCYSPPLGFPFITTKSIQHLWNIYQRLALRLRLGGSSQSSVECDFFSNVHYEDVEYEDDDGLSKECVAINLLESPPAVHGVTYLLDGTELYIGLNGAFFELYAVLPATVSPKHGCQACTKLVRKLMADAKKMFILNPPTFRL